VSPARFEVVAVRYGTRTTRRSESYLNHFVYGEPDAAFAMDYFFWVVRDRNDPAGTVVVDCGFDPEVGRRRGREVLADPVEALAALGIDAGAVRRVVVTHAHYDHIGTLHRFPVAEIVVARRELDFWAGPLAGRTQFAHATEPGELAVLARAAEQGRVRTVDDRLELAPGFELVVVGGHTPGQLIALVAVDGPGTAVLAADALHFYDELALDRPFFVSPTSPRCTPASTCCARSPRAPATCSWPGTTRRWPSGSRAGSTAPASTTS
jgi:glyoxylase-like metal-dependent hydrolase (beta-lactamase superfamily II)